MYGQDNPHLPWGSPQRRRVTGGNEVDSQTKRHSTGMNYFGLETSEPSGATGGVIQFSRPGGHVRSESVGTTAVGIMGEGNARAVGEKSQRDKVNQIVQAFFWKAAMVIIQSRMSVAPLLSPRSQERKTNKWFNIELDEMETFRDELRIWRVGDSFDPRPPPLIIETYLDTSDLTPTQALVILDSDEKRWNVAEALENAANRAGVNLRSRAAERSTNAAQKIVLERWKIELSPPYDLNNNLELPVVYKKGIILFRALYSYLSLMPTWKFRRRLAKLKLHTSALKIGCKVQSGYDMARSTPQWDALQVPFFSATEDVTDNFSFGKVESPAGSFSITVSYRKNCDFRVDDSESLLSSHFINLDEHYFRPSLHQRVSTQPAAFAPGRVLEPGSLPAAIPSSFPQRPEPNLAYGSLSSFHQPTGHANASPLAVLRSAAEMADRGSYNASPAERPSSALKSIQDSKSSLRSNDVASMSRRGSLSFQPFKTPSLSASPATPDPYTASSLGRISMPPSVVQTHKHRLSIGTMSPYKSTNSSTPQPQGDPTNQNPIPISTKPHPMTRITSSFGSRRPRVSSAASVTRADDDNSSGHASFSSSVVNPGSGLYPPPGTSSYEEDLQIRDFMSMLADGQKKSLKSLGGGGMSSSASGVKVGNPLSKFQKMKDSQTALVDSMSSSLLLLPSSPSTSSRNLSSVPGMIQSTTFSSSSSPGKPLSPHTPHTPAVPSRLRGLTAQYDQHRDSQRRHPRSTPSSQPRHAGDQRTEGTATTSPLDIPLSPRFMGPRRSNSMSQQHREAIDGNSLEFDPLTVFDNRRRHSSSLGGGDKEPLSTSQLLDLRNASESALSGRETSESGPQRANDAGDDRLAFGPQPLIDNPSGDAPRYAHRFHRGVGMAASGSSYRSRLSSRGRGDTPPMGSTSSLDKNQTGMAINSVRPSIVGRRTPSWPRPNHEDEELLFTMSDMMVAQQSRRSLDQDKTSGSEASSSLSSRRRSRGTSGVHSGQKAGSGGGAGGVGWMAG